MEILFVEADSYCDCLASSEITRWGLFLRREDHSSLFGSDKGIFSMRLCCSVTRTRFSNAFYDDTSNIESSTEDNRLHRCVLLMIYLPTTVSDEQTEGRRFFFNR